MLRATLRSPHPPTRSLAIVVLAVSTLLAGPAVAEDWPRWDWPQWGGPERNFHAEARPLADDWGQDGPPVLWSLEIGPGHAGPVVADGVVYVTYRDGGEEVILALSEKQGGLVWRHRHSAKLWDGFNEQFGTGPHVTPLVAGDRLVTVTVRGDVLAFDRKSGELAWSEDLWKRGARPTDRGYGSSPLAVDDVVVVLVPGGDGGVIALDRASGEVAWETLELPNPAFAAPVAAELAGREQIVVFASKEVLGLDPGDGEVLWRHRHETKYNVNASPPLVLAERGRVVVSSAYDTGTRAISLAPGENGAIAASEDWFSRDLEVHHQSFVALGEIVVGSSGDFGPAFLVGLDLGTGEEVFKRRGFAKANLLAVGEDRLLVLDEDGKLGLLEIRTGEAGVEVNERAAAQIFDSRTWAVPALVGTTLFARDQKKIVALDLAPRPSGKDR